MNKPFSVNSIRKLAKTATTTLLATALEAVANPLRNSSLLIVNLIDYFLSFL